MKQIESEVRELGRRLQADLLAFSGKLPGPTPRFRTCLLIPVAVIMGAAVLFSILPKARKSLLLEIAVLASTRLLQGGAEPLPPPTSASYRGPIPPVR